jgi:hypothetical protein
MGEKRIRRLGTGEEDGDQREREWMGIGIGQAPRLSGGTALTGGGAIAVDWRGRESGD